MKIYNKLVLNIDTWEVLEEDSFEYSGDLALCYSSNSSSSVDKKYNARMATIAEAQQGMAEEQFREWQMFYKQYERKQVAANTMLLPYETAHAQAGLEAETALTPQRAGLESAQIGAEQSLLPQRTAYESAQISTEMGLMPQRAGLESSRIGAAQSLLPQQTAASSKFYEQAMAGVDVEGRANTAAADVTQAWKGADASSRRSASRMGVSATSGRMADMLKTSSLDKARMVGSARTTARTGAQDEEFRRLAMAQQYSGLPTRV